MTTNLADFSFYVPGTRSSSLEELDSSLISSSIKNETGSPSPTKNVLRILTRSPFSRDDFDFLKEVVSRIDPSCYREETGTPIYREETRTPIFLRRFRVVSYGSFDKEEALDFFQRIPKRLVPSPLKIEHYPDYDLMRNSPESEISALHGLLQLLSRTFFSRDDFDTLKERSQRLGYATTPNSIKRIFNLINNTPSFEDLDKDLLIQEINTTLEKKQKQYFFI